MAAFSGWLTIIGGGVIAVAALLLLYAALLRDRARGRRRCPKCWYDMSASPGLVCSECGYAAKRERKLRKTRRRWRRAIASAMLLLIGVALTATPRVYRTGWTSFVPTTVLVFAAPQLEKSPDSPLSEELIERAARNDLKPWQWNVLMRQWEQSNPAAWPADAMLSDVWVAGVPIPVRASSPKGIPFWAVRTNFGASLVPLQSSIVDWESDHLIAALDVQRLQLFNPFGPTPGGVSIVGRKEFTGRILAAGEHEVRFRAELHMLASTGGTRFGMTSFKFDPAVPPLISREIGKTIHIVESIDDVMNAVEDDAFVERVKSALEIVPIGGDMQVYALTTAQPRNYAVGGVAELYRNGELHGRSYIWVDRNGKVHTISGRLGHSSWILQNEELVRGSKWTFRFRGGDEAIYDRNARSYWSGEIELELEPHPRWHHWLSPKRE